MLAWLTTNTLLRGRYKIAYGTIRRGEACQLATQRSVSYLVVKLNVVKPRGWLYQINARTHVYVNTLDNMVALIKPRGRSCEVKSGTDSNNNDNDSINVYRQITSENLILSRN